MLLHPKLQRHAAAVVTPLRARCGPTLLLTLTLVSCAAPPKPAAPKPAVAKVVPAASGEAPLPPEPPLPVLASGARLAEDHQETLYLKLLARAQDGAFEVLEYELPAEFAAADWQQHVVHLEGAERPYAFLGQDWRDKTSGVPPMRLWVRRPIAEQGRDLNGECYSPAEYSALGLHQRFHATATRAQPKPDPKLITAWALALAQDFDLHHGPFYGFAADQLRQRAGKPKLAARGPYAERVNRDDFAQLIGTATGRSSIQEALERNRDLYLELASGPRKISIDELTAPRLTRHPWATMLGQLKQKPPDEPLAQATPADFYFLRVRDFSSFLDLSAVADSWGGPALDVLDGRTQDRALGERYQTELALEQGELSRTFGPSVIAELALVGSDPYLVEGSDLTLIFRAKSALLFDAALFESLSAFAVAHPGGNREKFSHEGVEVTVTRSADGQIRRHRASVQGFELVSNSPAAIRRVISTIHGKARRLSDEPDFSYMLARDADQAAPILGFAGDRFVESVIGPAQKIKEAERALALAELSRPGYAALLYGFLMGHSPAITQDLVREKLLSAADSRPGGVAAGWQPGMIARSSRGSTLAAEPLIDAPAIARVTSAERAGYEFFARSYENDWSEYVDPFAVRVSRTRTASGGLTLSAQLRVLPLLRREYRELTASVGDAHVAPGSVGEGFRVLLGVGKDAELRRLLTSAAHRFTESAFTFDWLGDYAFVGLADRNELALAARYDRDISPEKPDSARTRDPELRAAALTPAYAGIAIRSTAAAAVALAVLKRVGDEVAPNSLIWSDARKHRGVTLMSVHGNDADVADIKLYYALTPHVLLFSLNPAVLEALIDQFADGNAPTTAAAPAPSGDPQLVVDLKGKPQGAIATVLTWMLTKALTEGSARARDAANAIFFGAPEIASDPDRVARLMRNYLGSAVKTPEGREYSFGPDGVRDPLRGSASSPAWPLIPVPGSPVAQVVDGLESLRSELSFDSEPSTQPGTALQSVRVRLTLALH